MAKVEEEAWVVSQEEVALRTFRLQLRSPRIARRAAAGQFCMLRVREGLDPFLRRPLSFHRIFPKEGVIEILYRVVGQGTWLLSQCTSGSRLSLIGPLGNTFHLPHPDALPVFLIAGGIGIAPLFEVILQLVNHKAEASAASIHLFYGARTASELLPAEFFDDTGISIHWSTDDGTLGYCGYVTDLLQKVAEERTLRPALLYSCGPLAMQVQVARWVSANGVPAELSLESLMACGVGACLGCALPAPHPHDPAADHYVHVCKDGPIFDSGSIQWNKMRPQQIFPRIFLYN